jgi:hypothetical protein
MPELTGSAPSSGAPDRGDSGSSHIGLRPSRYPTSSAALEPFFHLFNRDSRANSFLLRLHG